MDLYQKVVILEPLTISEIRQLRGFTQAEMARIMGIRYNTYIKKEYGWIDWKFSEIKKLSECLGIPLDKIQIEDT